MREWRFFCGHVAIFSSSIIRGTAVVWRGKLLMCVPCRFYNGGAREKTILMNAYMRLIKHVNSIFKVRLQDFTS